MASYYKRLQTVISYGEEDLYHFVESQNMKNSLYIKKLIREEMIRQAGKGNIPVQPEPKQYKEPVQEPVDPPKEEVTKQEDVAHVPHVVSVPPVVEKTEDKKPRNPVKLDGGGAVF